MTGNLLKFSAWVAATYKMMAAENLFGALTFLAVVAAVCLGPLVLAGAALLRLLTGGKSAERANTPAEDIPVELMYRWLETPAWRALSVLVSTACFAGAKSMAGAPELALGAAGLGLFALICAAIPAQAGALMRDFESQARQRRQRRAGTRPQKTDGKDQ